MCKNSQFEECSTVPLGINGSLAGISDFGEDIVSEAAGSDSGGISSHDGSENDTDSDYITEPSTYQQFLHPSTEKSWTILYSRDSNCKACNYHKEAGDNL